MNPSIIKASTISNAWTQLAPAVDFAGIARADIEGRITDATDAENALAQSRADVVDKQGTRDLAIAALVGTTKRVVNGVKGDAAYGPDSDLYEAMGYVKDMDRKSGLHRRTTPPVVTP